MLNVFTKSIIASSVCLLSLYCPIVQGEGRVAIAINAMHDHELY